jgi:hypothetical protein
MQHELGILVGNPEEKKPLGRPRRKWADVREIKWGDVGWIHLAQDMDQWTALVNKIINLRTIYKFGKFLSSWATGSFMKLV